MRICASMFARQVISLPMICARVCVGVSYRSLQIHTDTDTKTKYTRALLRHKDVRYTCIHCVRTSEKEHWEEWEMCANRVRSMFALECKRSQHLVYKLIKLMCVCIWV